MYINKKIEEIELKHGRIVKSNYVLAYWIHQSTYFIKTHKNKYTRKLVARKIYKLKHRAIRDMVKTGENNLRIYKPSDKKSLWLVVLNRKLEGVEYNLVIPYEYIKNEVDIESMEETDINRDCIFINDREFKTDVYNNSNIDLKFCLQNMEKSRLKMLEKLEDVKKEVM